MSIKITEKDKKFLTKILKHSRNEIDNIYKFEGFIVGMICSEDVLPPSVFMEDMFGGPDDDDAMSWDSLEQLNQFMELHSKINNKNATKLQSHIYRPIFAKTREQIRDYAFGFLATYDIANISSNANTSIKLAFIAIRLLYKADHELPNEDAEDYKKLIEILDKSPVKMLSNAVYTLNQARLENYIPPQDIKNNVFNFDDMDSTYH